MHRKSFKELLQHEFSGYNYAKFYRDFLAGLTVAAVALPLALAFGVASGATAPAGLVTAILGGLIIGGLSGAPYQISGPTGAMSAVLVLLAQRHGIQGVWVAGAMAGVFLLLIGILKLGRFLAFIPSPVITGFTSGISAIIIIGQLENLLGIKLPGSESAAGKLWNFLQGGWSVNLQSLIAGGLVMLCMLLWPKDWNLKFPGSLLGLILVTGGVVLLGWPIAHVAEIPSTLLLGDRLTWQSIPWDDLKSLVAPAFSIAALGGIESLLCGAVAANMTGIRLHANQELIAQGVGNIIIPFFGGVPATAAIARTSVAIKSGGQTRLTSIVHALMLLASIYVLGPIMSRVPLSALAGILIITAWRMNEWEEIHYIFKHRLKTAIASFLLTMAATVSLDLTEAIILGTVLSAAVFLSQIAQIDVELQEIESEKLLERGIIPPRKCPHTRVAFITGPLFFAATGHFNEALSGLKDCHVLVLSMRGVPLIDVSGLQALEHLIEKLSADGGTLMLAGVHEDVLATLKRGGLYELIGDKNIFWSSDQAIAAASEKSCRFCNVLS
ncbi:MAG: SulP family inorganic anion transporter [Oligoflexia bacterium]|nr:SulP family inorganic anion transporter [Oligoflexia bacterium]